jgi:hypothetical protein
MISRCLTTGATGFDSNVILLNISDTIMLDHSRPIRFSSGSNGKEISIYIEIYQKSSLRV